MSIENLLAGTGIDYTVKDGICYIKAERCRTRVNISDNPERDIMAYINKTQGCKISSLCRHTGCTRYRVTQIVEALCDSGKARKIPSSDGYRICPN